MGGGEHHDGGVPTGHNAPVGETRFTAIRNTHNTGWVPVDVAVRVTAPPPTGLTASPLALLRGDPYTITMGGGSSADGGMVIDYKYTVNGGAERTAVGLPLSPEGTYTFPTDTDTPVGITRFTAIRNTHNAAWVPVNVPVEVIARQPTDLSASASVLDQGEAYTIAVAGGVVAGGVVVIDYKYTLNGGAEQTALGLALTDAGTYTFPTGNDTPVGVTRFTAIRNTLRNDWVAVDVPVEVRDRTFELEVSPSDVLRAERGGAARLTITVAPEHGFSSPVSLSASELPAELTRPSASTR